MTGNYSKSFLSYLNKHVGQYNDTYYYSIDKKPNDTDYLALAEQILSSYMAPKFEIDDRENYFA